jgi:hypothetical protein
VRRCHTALLILLVAGIWTGTVADRNGDLQDFSFRFFQNGDKVTGKMYGDNESTPVQGIEITGDRIAFTVTTELNGQITKFLYTGTIDGNEMDLLRKRTDKPDPAAKDTKLRLKRIT